MPSSYKKIMMNMTMSISIPMSTRHGFPKQLVAPSAWTYIMMRSSVWLPLYANTLNGTIPLKSSRLATNNLTTLSLMKVKLVVACGVDRIFAMAFSAESTMNVNLVAVARLCLLLTIDASQYLATTAQGWTILELNTRTEITTSTDRTISCQTHPNQYSLRRRNLMQKR